MKTRIRIVCTGKSSTRSCPPRRVIVGIESCTVAGSKVSLSSLRLHPDSAVKKSADSASSVVSIGLYGFIGFQALHVNETLVDDKLMYDIPRGHNDLHGYISRSHVDEYVEHLAYLR